MSLLTHVVDWLVPFICGGVATVLGLMWRWGKAMVNGLRELLLCQLEDLRREMVIEHDGVADEDLKSRSQRLYDSYHSLGGNGASCYWITGMRATHKKIPPLEFNVGYKE